MENDATVGWIAAIVIGGIAGWLAEQFMKSNLGLLTNIVLGIVGAIVASYLGKAVGWYEPGEGAGFIGAIVGAVIILVVWGFIAGRSATR